MKMKLLQMDYFTLREEKNDMKKKEEKEKKKEKDEMKMILIA